MTQVNRKRIRLPSTLESFGHSQPYGDTISRYRFGRPAKKLEVPSNDFYIRDYIPFIYLRLIFKRDCRKISKKENFCKKRNASYLIVFGNLSLSSIYWKLPKEDILWTQFGWLYNGIFDIWVKHHRPFTRRDLSLWIMALWLLL